MRNRRRRAAAAVAVALSGLLFLASCGDEEPEVSTTTDADSGEEPAKDAGSDGGQGSASASATAPIGPMMVSCGAVQLDGTPVDPSSFPPLGDREDEIDLTSIQGEHEIFETHDWYVAEESGDELALLGVPHDPDPDAAHYAYATLAREGDSWVPSQWGGCRVSVEAEGWGNARFVLEPDVEPDPESATLPLQAWEVECANGEPPEGREVRPVVLNENDETVSIVVLVEPVTGGANCPSNPAFTVDVELDQPLGDRTVLDASMDPALERPWPPTESSLSSMGRDQ